LKVKELETIIQDFCQKNDFAGLLNSHFVRKDMVNVKFVKLEEKIKELKEEILDCLSHINYHDPNWSEYDRVKKLIKE